MLLTSAGLRNPALRATLAELLGKPYAQARVTFVITAALAAPGDHDWVVAELRRVHKLGWARFTVVDLAALPMPMLLEQLADIDVLYVTGGNAYHLAQVIHSRRLARSLRDLLDRVVYVGASAGSMILSTHFTERLTGLFGTGDPLFQHHGSEAISPLDVLDFGIHPHADLDAYDPGPARSLGLETYAIDDDTAVRVCGGRIDVVGGGRWIQVPGL
ncbi:Type 1 glutamine amidotransferase-like domain-containing protein [Longispora albida]|uniref:Type 1 glutamine amidotransferase-like domain-containing protein n=1 Tax=Longispora albida TaxID=203523 RepID=UPI000377E652|nr:Type 1 glutamine amidotransferase-like domain-containing protein [Longispora albida]